MSVQDHEHATDFLVPNMTCNNCVTHVKNALNNVEGVEGVEIDLSSKNVIVYHNKDIEFDKLETAVTEAGYQAKKK